MRKSLMMLMVLTQPAFADGRTALTGDQITTALTARVLVYEDGTRQQFYAGGTTRYESPEPSSGSWRVEGDRYCSQWPPSDRWTCYHVVQSGFEIRFVADDGAALTGRYADLP